MARAVSKAFLQGLAWTLAYYVHGNIPLLLPGDFKLSASQSPKT